MTGFRLGYLAAPLSVAKACAKIQGQITSCASSLAQAAGVAALNLPSGALDDDIAEFKRRRDLVLELLENAARNGRVAAPPPPEGAFYVFCDVAPCLDLSVDGERVGTSTNFCKLLLKKRKLALVPGDAFGAPTGIRLSYAASEEDLRTALAALDAFANEDCR
jgi:aspartate aminotransferase/aspartate/glutamate/aspartate-prephenate aminotransferase